MYALSLIIVPKCKTHFNKKKNINQLKRYRSFCWCKNFIVKQVLKHSRSDRGGGVGPDLPPILVVHKTSASLKCVTFVQIQMGT